MAAVALRSAALLMLVFISATAVRWVVQGSAPDAASGKRILRAGFQFNPAVPSYGIQSRNRRLVYPYSVIPGGVRSGDELREVAAHDPVVAQHYAGFDYAHARLVELDRPRLVYVSYRRNGQIHWSSKQATLQPGEKVITDGKMTARTRCGNQVSVLPQANTAPNEPTMAELERPDAAASGAEQLFPESSALLNLDPLIPLAPPFGAFPQTGAFIPLPIAGGLSPNAPGSCVPVRKKKDASSSKSSKECVPLPPPAPVPELGTMLLLASGAATVYAKVRLRRSQCDRRLLP